VRRGVGCKPESLLAPSSTAGLKRGQRVNVYGFDMVFVSEIDWSGSSGDDEPLERVTFAYGALAFGYYPLKPDGTFEPAVKTSWSQVTNTAPPPDPALTGF
jgi:hypothetical protein